MSSQPAWVHVERCIGGGSCIEACPEGAASPVIQADTRRSVYPGEVRGPAPSPGLGRR
ncbi:MAG: 4Fe-4S binding protein [Anaerolineae bacterium]|nr:4Fe-4S binding protein [Anaerolineae bacterium]